MPTLYCDHNVLISVLENEGFPPAGQFANLLNSGRVDLVFSTTHLIEAAKMRSREEATSMARLIEHAARLWLADRISLELDEIRHVLDGGPAPQPLLRTVTEMMAKLLTHHRIPRIVTALTLVQGWHVNPRLLDPLLASHQQNVRAFRANVRDTKRKRKGRLHRMLDADVMRLVVQNMARIFEIPLDPDRLAALDIQSMPTNHAELVLSRQRWIRGGDLRWQTFMDSEHLIAALPHVDVYMTFDRRMGNLARALRRQCSSCSAQVVGSFRDAITALGI